MRTRLPALTLALASLVAVDAHAVRPPENTSLGFSTVPVQRVRTERADVQAMLEAQPAWQAFVSAEGQGWEATFDEVTRVPVRMWGKGIDLGPTATERDVSKAAWGFVEQHRSLFGVEGAELEMTAVNRYDKGDVWYVDVVPSIDGVPVWHSLVTLRFKAGKLVMAGADTFPGATLTGAFDITERAALRSHVLEGSAPRAQHTDMSVEPALLPLVLGGKPELRRVFVTHSRTAEPRGIWQGLVDAQTGELLSLSNQIRFFSGTITAEHDGRLGPGTTAISALPFAEVRAEEIDGSYVDDTYTDRDGNFTVDDAAVYTVSLDGERARIFDQLGDLQPELDPANLLVTPADFGDRAASLTTFVSVHTAQDWARELAPEVGWSNQRVRAFVNIDDRCNAFFDGDVNFFQAGDGCNNTGRLADVIFHEWGHGFHTYSILSGFYDGSVGEGAADTMSFLMTDDSRIAPNFFTRGGELRNTDNNRRYPDDFVPGEFAIHSNGLIFGGSMWDTREALRSSVGEPMATEIAGSIYAGTLKGGPSIETAYSEAVFSDDDDGDLSNGTPHQCEIVDGFALHGLGPAAGRGLRANHVPIENAAADLDVPVDLGLPNPAPDCFTIEASGGTVHYRINGGDWLDTTTDVIDGEIEGSIPGAELGDLVEYWVEITDTTGGTYAEPPGGIIRPHTFYVGDVLEVVCSDFEGSGDGGYTHELVSGEETEGADDWVRGEPVGLGGDPVGCYSGEFCWGNDLGGDNFNGEYQNDKQNRLTSRAYELEHYEESFLHYRRWLTVEDGYYDRARILADGEEIWTNWASERDNGQEHHVDDAWAAHAVPFTDADDNGRVRFSWEIQSDQGLSFGGWTIDDVCIYAPATVGNRLGINDLTLSRGFEVGPGVLSFTTPKHGPVTEVVVVRKGGSYPTDPSDGAVIWRSTDPELGAPVVVTDTGALGRGNIYYAVYASDGQDWLPWTVEGFNAAALDPTSAGTSCGGCNGSGLTPPWWLALVGLVGLRRRRD